MQQLSTKSILYGCGLAVVLTAAPVAARVGVSEDLTVSAEASTTAAPHDEGGSGTSSSGYSDDEGGFYVKGADGQWKLVIGGRLQSRLDWIGYDGDSDTEEDADFDDVTTFQVRRVRMYMLGNFLGDMNTFYVQIGADSANRYANESTGTNDFRIYDAWVKHKFSESFAIKAGQFKTPFHRASLTSNGKMQFAERPRSTNVMPWDLANGGRDTGIEVSGGLNGGKFQYAAALVNGDGPNTANLDEKIAFVGRLSLNPSGDYGYSEGDTENSDTLASTIGLAARYQSEDPYALGADSWGLNLDAGIKSQGFSAQGEITWVKWDTDEDDSLTDNHAYVQAGYFVSPRRIELVARGSKAFFEGADNDRSEVTAGVNWYWNAHRVKWQSAYTFYDTESVATDLKDNRFISQIQVWW